MFDINALTMGELTQVEELSGQPFSALSDENAPKGKLFTALILVAKRRTNPAFSWSEAEATPLSVLSELLGSADPKAQN